MAYLLIVPPGQGARLEAVRGTVPFLREFSACENVLAVAMPPGFDREDAIAALLREFGQVDFALVEITGAPQGFGPILSAIAEAGHARVFKPSPG